MPPIAAGAGRGNRQLEQEARTHASQDFGALFDRQRGVRYDKAYGFVCCAFREVTQLEWKRIQEMIGEVEHQDRREDFARWLFQWDFAVREFRKVEQRLITLGTPSNLDWHAHSVCLRSLIGAGHAIILASKAFKAEELSQFGVTHLQIEAYVADLEQSLREWHHSFAEADISDLQQAIFGCAS